VNTMNDKNCTLLLDYYNDQLSSKEKEEFEHHLKECDDCQELYAELMSLDEDVAHAPSATVVPTGMKERILESVFKDEDTRNSISGVDKKETPNLKQKKSKPWLGLSTAAAILLLVGWNIYSLNQITALENELAVAQNERNELIAIVDELNEEPDQNDPFTQIVAEAQLDELGVASILQNENGIQLLIQVSNMPALSQDEVYQVWIINDGTPSPAGAFVTNEGGHGAVTYTLSDNDEILGEAIAISLEPQANNQEPQGEILVVSEL
jgi:hypothetical protein